MPSIGADAVGGMVAVEFDLYDSVADVMKTLRVCSSPDPVVALREISPGVMARRLFQPGLVVPFQLGARVEVTNYSPRGVANGGVIEFAIDDVIRPFLSYICMGREFRVYEGPRADLGDTTDRIMAYADLWSSMTLVYVGRIVGLSHDTMRARFSTTDARNALDKPFITDLYDETVDGVPEVLQGLPKPYLWGQAYSLAPVLVDPALYTYQVTSTGFDTLSDLPRLVVRVGGILWEEVASSPSPGEYSVNDAAGMFTLGGTPDGSEIRVTAPAPGWQTFRPDSLIREIVTGAGGTVDEASLTQLLTDLGFGTGPGFLVGYYLSTTPVNTQDILDDVMAGLFGWWCAKPLGDIAAGLIRAPVAPADLVLTEVEIESIELVSVIPPAWRVRVEYARNWMPGTQWFSAVSEEEQQERASGGVIALEWDATVGDPDFKDKHPQAIDLPLIRSPLQFGLPDASNLRDGVRDAINVERRVWGVTIRVPSLPELYQVVEIDHPLVSGLFRVTSVIRSFGGGRSALQLWG